MTWPVDEIFSTDPDYRDPNFRRYYIGNSGPFFYDPTQLIDDDEDPTNPFIGQPNRGVSTEQLMVLEAPTELPDVMRAEDVFDGIILDGDNIDLDFSPANYTPDDSDPGVLDDARLGAHLAGIDAALDSTVVTVITGVDFVAQTVTTANVRVLNY